MTKPPVVILAGSDRQPAELPPSGRDKHPITGYKGVDVRIQGRPIAAVVAERLAACGCLGPVHLAGPAAIFRDAVPGVTLIDADGTFGGNIRRAIEVVTASHPGAPVAFTVCDIVPETATLDQLLADYERAAPCDLWYPMIHAPEDERRLGAAAWKPSYLIVPRPGVAAVRVLPGHLAIADLATLRLSFLYRLLQIGYETRNRSIIYRRGAMLRGLLAGLLGRDFKLLFALRAPTLTWTVAGSGVRAARELRRGTITRSGLEDALRRILVRREHRRRHPERRVLTPIAEGLSMALDIDTEEEARELGGDVRRRGAPGL